VRQFLHSWVRRVKNDYGREVEVDSIKLRIFNEGFGFIECGVFTKGGRFGFIGLMDCEFYRAAGIVWRCIVLSKNIV